MPRLWQRDRTGACSAALRAGGLSTPLGSRSSPTPPMTRKTPATWPSARSLERSGGIAPLGQPPVHGHRRPYLPPGPTRRGRSVRAWLGTGLHAGLRFAREILCAVGAAAGIIGSVAIAAWKLKVVGVVLLTKGKLLLLGLTKASTFLSMMASLGVYWTVFGGWLALGLVLSIYIHEMGHVFVLMRYGVRASTPLFIPGLGAFIRLKQAIVDPKQDARVGLGGPIWGTGAALVCSGMYHLTSKPIWAAIAQLGAIINLFNLLPFWQLDGAHAFRSLNRSQRLAGRRRNRGCLGGYRPEFLDPAARRRQPCTPS